MSFRHTFMLGFSSVILVNSPHSNTYPVSTKTCWD